VLGWPIEVIRLLHCRFLTSHARASDRTFRGLRPASFSLERHYAVPIRQLVGCRVLTPLGRLPPLILEQDDRAIMPPELSQKTVQGYSEHGAPIGAPHRPEVRAGAWEDIDLGEVAIVDKPAASTMLLPMWGWFRRAGSGCFSSQTAANFLMKSAATTSFRRRRGSRLSSSRGRHSA
jgi:hypothetical protein